VNPFNLKIKNIIHVILITFIILAPLYNFPFMYIENAYDLEHANFRAFKDYFLLLILVIALFYGVFNGTVKIRKRTVFPFFSIFILALLKYFYLNDVLTIDYYRFFFFGPLLYIVTISVVKTKKAVYEILFSFLIVSLLVSLIGIYQFLFIDILHQWSIAAGQKRVSSTLFSPNALAWYLVAINSLIMSLLLIDKHERKKLLIIILLVNFFVILLTGSRGGVSYSLISICVHFIIVSGKMKLNLIRYSFYFIPFIFFAIYKTSLSESRAMSSIDNSRSIIYAELLNRLNILPLSEYFFGVSSYNYRILKSLSILDDSFILTLLPIFGICGFIFLIFSLNKILSISIFKNRNVISITLFMFLAISFTGNVLYIFPHSILFWFLVGLSQVLTKLDD
jgi:hypothetical protein